MRAGEPGEYYLSQLTEEGNYPWGTASQISLGWNPKYGFHAMRHATDQQAWLITPEP